MELGQLTERCKKIKSVSECVLVQKRERTLISAFAKWSKSERTGSCDLHFLPSSSTLPLLPFLFSPEPRCAYVLGCFNFGAHNWDEPQGALLRWDDTINTRVYSLTLSVRTLLSFSLTDAKHSRNTAHKLIKQVNRQPRGLV